MQSHRIGILILIAVLGTVACGGGGGGVGVTLPTSSISGLVSDTRGGPAVGGASVVIQGTTFATTTDGNGAFSFGSVPVGTYNLLATRAGYGSSRLQGVSVVAAATTQASMLMRKSFDPAKPTTAPTISVSGLTPGQTVSGNVSFTIDVAAANPMFLIQVRFGHRGDVPNFSRSDAASVTVSWLTTSNANGASFVDILAYDNNNNLAEWSVPVTVNNGPSGGVPGAPASVFATAVTFGRPLNTFFAQRQAMARANQLRGDPGKLSLPNGRFLDIQAAPSDSTLFVYVQWLPVSGAAGYKVYRSFAASGPFPILADARAGDSAACAGVGFAGITTKCHRDSSPDLAVGKAVFYRVTAYTTAGESPQSATVNSTPLAVFNLNLTAPADEDTAILPGGVGSQTFSWAPVAAVGTLRHYEGFVGGVNDSTTTWWFFCVDNNTTITYGPSAGSETCPANPMASPLQRAKRYEWDVNYAYARIIYGGTGDAFSMAGFPAFGLFPLSSSGSLNGPFHFTTTP